MATIDLLAERGYPGTSTRIVAERAGVSQGALQHHFPSRSELCVAAMSLLINRLSREFKPAIPETDDPIERFGSIIDRLMTIFGGPTFTAGLELRLAARTDTALGAGMIELDRELEAVFESGAGEMLPELVSRPGFDGLIQLTLSSIRGLALARLGPDRGDDESWPAVREELVAVAERVGRSG